MLKSLPCTLIPAWVKVTADTLERDGAQLFGLEEIELQARDEPLGDDDAEIVLKRPTLVLVSTSTPKTKRS